MYRPRSKCSFFGFRSFGKHMCLGYPDSTNYPKAVFKNRLFSYQSEISVSVPVTSPCSIQIDSIVVLLDFKYGKPFQEPESHNFEQFVIVGVVPVGRDCSRQRSEPISYAFSFTNLVCCGRLGLGVLGGPSGP